MARSPSLSASLLIPCLAASWGCGGDEASRCPADGQRLTILAPAEGDHVTAADDVDPAASGTQIELAVLACGFDPGSQIEVWETASLMSRYAVLDVRSREDVTHAIVPILPVDYTIEARSVDGEVRSEPVSFTVGD